jgi:hypothetical protein
MRDKKIRDRFPMVEGTFFNHHLSFFNRKTRENAPLGLSYRHWVGRNDVAAFPNIRLLQRRIELSSPPCQLVSKFPKKNKEAH